MERNAFHVSYLSDKIPEALFHGQAVKTVAYLRVSTAQQDVRSQRLAILDALAKVRVAFVAMKENMRIEGQRDIQTKVMTTLFALFGEVERDLISERTREGLAKARVSGRKLGCPKGSLGVSRLNGKEDAIRCFLDLGVYKTAIAKLTGVSRPTLYSFMSTRGLKPSHWRVFLHGSDRSSRSAYSDDHDHRMLGLSCDFNQWRGDPM